jgi:hypothetical protein
LTLVGELLFKITGISGKTDLEEEEGGEVDTSTVEISRKALTEQLGPERRDRLLASFYILRQDAVSLVRQSAIQIWKALVQNTPRTSTSPDYGGSHRFLIFLKFAKFFLLSSTRF